MPHLHTAESHMFWWSWDDLMVFLVRPSRGSNSVAWQDFVARTRKGESDLYDFMNLMTYETYHGMNTLWDFWVTWGSCHVHLSMPRMFLRCMNKVSQMIRTADLRPRTAQNLWFQEFRGTAWHCDLQVHSWRGWLRPRTCDTELLATWRQIWKMSCTQGRKAHPRITVPATTLTNQQILASWSASASRPMVKRLSLLRVIWCRENIKGGTGKNNKAKIQYNHWILDLL